MYITYAVPRAKSEDIAIEKDVEPTSALIDFGANSCKAKLRNLKWPGSPVPKSSYVDGRPQSSSSCRFRCARVPLQEILQMVTAVNSHNPSSS